MRSYDWNEVIREMREDGFFKAEVKEVVRVESLSVDELIEQLQLIKSKVGGGAKVYSLECGYEKDISSVRIDYYDGNCVVLE